MTTLYACCYQHFRALEQVEEKWSVTLVGSTVSSLSTSVWKFPHNATYFTCRSCFFCATTELDSLFVGINQTLV